MENEYHTAKPPSVFNDQVLAREVYSQLEEVFDKTYAESNAQEISAVVEIFLHKLSDWIVEEAIQARSQLGSTFRDYAYNELPENIADLLTDISTRVLVPVAEDSIEDLENDHFLKLKYLLLFAKMLTPHKPEITLSDKVIRDKKEHAILSMLGETDFSDTLPAPPWQVDFAVSPLELSTPVAKMPVSVSQLSSVL